MPATHKRRKKNYKPTRKNCNPTIKGNTITENSCITPPMLMNTPFEGNKSIHDVINECKDDKCIISKVSDKNKQHAIEQSAFVPKQPNDWKLNINEWLSDADIEKVIKQYQEAHGEFEFYGPSYIDFDTIVDGRCVEEPLCKFSLQDCVARGKTKIGFSFNLDDHTKGGSHWVSMFVDVKERYIFYFDSAGDDIPNEIQILIRRIKQQAKDMRMRFRVYSNSPFEHQYGTTECGMYSLFFLITMLTNKYEDTEFKNTKHKVNFFMRYRISDKFVENKRFEYFRS